MRSLDNVHPEMPLMSSVAQALSLAALPAAHGRVLAAPER